VKISRYIWVIMHAKCERLFLRLLRLVMFKYISDFISYRALTLIKSQITRDAAVLSTFTDNSTHWHWWLQRNFRPQDKHNCLSMEGRQTTREHDSLYLTAFTIYKKVAFYFGIQFNVLCTRSQWKKQHYIYCAILTKHFLHFVLYLYICIVLFLPRCMQCRRGLAMRILSVRQSVCPSVKRVNCDKTEVRSVQIFVPCERPFSLVSWEEEWLVGATPST